jgi:superfamily II DNA helicase RecQ
VDERIMRGDFDILFASPEMLVGSHDLRKWLQECNVGVVVVDEFHTIYEWQVFFFYINYSIIMMRKSFLKCGF